MRAIYQLHTSELNSKFLAYIHKMFKDKLIKVIITDEETSEKDDDKEEKEWYSMSGQNLSNAYSESEPDYNLNMIKEPNPKYEGR
jgi:hypothetical protein